MQSNIKNIAQDQCPSPRTEFSSPTSQKIFVGGIPHDITLEELSDYFSEFGSVKQIDMPRNAKNGKLRGFSFVHFLSSEAVEKVFKKKNHSLKGKSMAIRRAMESNDASNWTKNLQNKKLYVSNLPKSNQITEKMIKRFFERFGPVDRVLMVIDSQRKQFRGFCYVVMKNQSDFDYIL